MTKNRMYPIYLQPKVVMSLQAMMNDHNWLWHLRYGYVNFRGMKLLAQKEMVTGLPLTNNPDNLCEGWKSSPRFFSS